MRDFLSDVRIGYYYFLKKTRRSPPSIGEVDEGLRYVYFPYFIAVLSLLVVLYTADNLQLVEVPLISKFLLGIGMFFMYNLIFKKIHKEILGHSMEADQTPAQIKKNILKFILLFLGGFASILVVFFISYRLTK
ncbi:hypothetical protein GCM10027347_28290 [Larkinella harenae]